MFDTIMRHFTKSFIIHIPLGCLAAVLVAFIYKTFLYADADVIRHTAVGAAMLLAIANVTFSWGRSFSANDERIEKVNTSALTFLYATFMFIAAIGMQYLAIKTKKYAIDYKAVDTLRQLSINCIGILIGYTCHKILLACYVLLSLMNTFLNDLDYVKKVQDTTKEKAPK